MDEARLKELVDKFDDPNEGSVSADAARELVVEFGKLVMRQVAATEAIAASLAGIENLLAQRQ